MWQKPYKWSSSQCSDTFQVLITEEKQRIEDIIKHANKQFLARIQVDTAVTDKRCSNKTARLTSVSQHMFAQSSLCFSNLCSFASTWSTMLFFSFILTGDNWICRLRLSNLEPSADREHCLWPTLCHNAVVTLVFPFISVPLQAGGTAGGKICAGRNTVLGSSSSWCAGSIQQRAGVLNASKMRCHKSVWWFAQPMLVSIMVCTWAHACMYYSSTKKLFAVESSSVFLQAHWWEKHFFSYKCTELQTSHSEELFQCKSQIIVGALMLEPRLCCAAQSAWQDPCAVQILMNDPTD